MRHALWPDGSLASHASEIEAFFAGTLAEPNAALIAEADATLRLQRLAESNWRDILSP